jgi:hypothetical protein
MTKENFLAAYRAELVSSYAWAADTAKLDRYMVSVTNTINGPEKSWIAEGAAVCVAWQKIGGNGQPTLKKLRALA